MYENVIMKPIILYGDLEIEIENLRENGNSNPASAGPSNVTHIYIYI